MKMASPVLWLDDGRAFLVGLDIPGRRPNFVWNVVLLLFMGAAWATYAVVGESYEPQHFVAFTLIVVGMLVTWFFFRRAAMAPRNWLTPEFFFLATYIAVHFSYIGLFAFGLVPQDAETFVEAQCLTRAVFYSICCLALFLVAYDLTGGLFPHTHDAPEIERPASLALPLSKALFVLTVLMFWGTLFYAGIGRVLTDYYYLSHLHLFMDNRLFHMSGIIGVIALALYAAVSGILRGQWLHGKVMRATVLAYLTLLVLMGDRTTALKFGVPLLMGFHYLVRTVKMRHFVLVVLAVGFLFAVVGVGRRAGTLNPVTMWKAYAGTEDRPGLVVQGAYELGTEIKLVSWSMALIPDSYPHWYGKPFLYALESTLLPNVGFQRQYRPQINTWLTETMFPGTTWGRGGSIAMEAYVNFGFLGGLAFFVFLGALYRALYEQFLRRPNLLWCAVVLCATATLVTFVRNTVDSWLRPWIWCMLLAWLMTLMGREPGYQKTYALQPAGAAPGE